MRCRCALLLGLATLAVCIALPTVIDSATTTTSTHHLHARVERRLARQGWRYVIPEAALEQLSRTER